LGEITGEDGVQQGGEEHKSTAGSSQSCRNIEPSDGAHIPSLRKSHPKNENELERVVEC
jgi:hypothetical protein